MKDFVALITPRPFGVSFAKGGFTARFAQTDLAEDDNGQIVFDTNA